MSDAWYAVSNVEDVASPALLIYPDRVEENIRRMVRVARGPGRLRPHIKTHKLGQLVRLHLAHGIQKFKCATIAEAEVLATENAPDVLVAYQLVGPNVARLLELVRTFPKTRFSSLIDHPLVARELSRTFAAAGIALDVWIDLDCGMHRTGIPPAGAVQLATDISSFSGMRFAGLHAYDGHIHDTDVAVRRVKCDASFAEVERLRSELERGGLAVPAIVAGGTPTFVFHAARPDIECSPGTCVLWDHGYATTLPDLDFLPSAAVLTRVVSKPAPDRLCLDLGHKAIASEMPHPRVYFPELTDANPVMHSEEHLVVETARAAGFNPGDAVFGIPWHICPTVALHSRAVVVVNGRASESWTIAARARKLTV